MSYELEHPTTNEHDPLIPWACEYPPETNTVGHADHHADCRRCVLAMGGVAMSTRAWVTDRDMSPALWYEFARHAHGLPPLPPRRATIDA